MTSSKYVTYAFPAEQVRRPPGCTGTATGPLYGQVGRKVDLWPGQGPFEMVVAALRASRRSGGGQPEGQSTNQKNLT